MARVLIDDPSVDVRELLARLVTMLGHEALTEPDGDLPDVLVFDPADPTASDRARLLRELAPMLPLVICSIDEPSPRTRALRPAAYVLKPFRRAEIEMALAAALS